MSARTSAEALLDALVEHAAQAFDRTTEALALADERKVLGVSPETWRHVRVVYVSHARERLAQVVQALALSPEVFAVTMRDRERLADGVMLASRLLNEDADSGNETWRNGTTAVERRRAADFLTRCIEAVMRGEYDAEIGRRR